MPSTLDQPSSPQKFDIAVWLGKLLRHGALATGLQYVQMAASLTFVVLYVWSTYSQPSAASMRARLELVLCAIFAVEYSHRLLVSGFVCLFVCMWYGGGWGVG